jgi:hypothetical protein
MADDIHAFLVARYAEEAKRWQTIWRFQAGDKRIDGYWDLGGTLGRAVNSVIDTTRGGRDLAAKRRIVELHTTGSYRTYQCSNGDHIQEWQCERAREPYAEHRYCEVCGGGACEELPLLAAVYAEHPDYNPGWRVA